MSHYGDSDIISQNEILPVTRSLGNKNSWGSSRCVIVTMLDSNLKVNEFELLSSTFELITMRKMWNPSIPSIYKFNSITAVLLQGWLWVTHEYGYIIKQRNWDNNPYRWNYPVNETSESHFLYCNNYGVVASSVK